MMSDGGGLDEVAEGDLLEICTNWRGLGASDLSSGRIEQGSR